MIRNPGKANDGLFLRDADGSPMVLDRDSGKSAPHTDPKVRVALHGEVKVKGGGTAVPAFMLMTEAYLTDEYAPETVAPKVGISAARIRELAADLAAAALVAEAAVFTERRNANAPSRRRRAPDPNAAAAPAPQRRAKTGEGDARRVFILVFVSRLSRRSPKSDFRF